MVKKRTKASKKKYGGSASYARALPFNTTAPNGGNPAQAAMNNMMESNAAQARMTKAYSGGAQSGFATVPSFGPDNKANEYSASGNATYMTGAANSEFDKFASKPPINKTGGSNKTKHNKKYRAKHNKKYNKTKKHKKKLSRKNK
jgi:hypothetical protein